MLRFAALTIFCSLTSSFFAVATPPLRALAAAMIGFGDAITLATFVALPISLPTNVFENAVISFVFVIVCIMVKLTILAQGGIRFEIDFW
jgi:hypothetical protein